MLPRPPAGRDALPADESSRAFLAVALQRQLQAMRAEIPGVRLAEDIECIHRMRVASRRARNLLHLMQGCLPAKRLEAWNGQLRGVTRALGAARDTDVQIDLLAAFEQAQTEPRVRPGLRRLLLRLRQQRSGLQVKLLKALDRLESSAALEKMETALLPLIPQAPLPSTHLLYQRAAHFVGGCLDDFLSYEPYIADPSRIAELHAMRISAKHLRYTLETFGALYSDGLEEGIRAVRKVQENLGDIHDCDVWTGYLPLFIEKERSRAREYYGHLRSFTPLLPGLTLFAQERSAHRGEVYNEFLARWKKWVRPPAKKGLPQPSYWEELRARVRQPLLPAQIYPKGAPLPQEEPSPADPVEPPAPAEEAPHA